MPQPSVSSPVSAGASSADASIPGVILPHGRRNFLKGCGAALVVSGLSLTGATAAEAALKPQVLVPEAPAVSEAASALVPDSTPAPASAPAAFTAPELFYRPVDHFTLNHFAPHIGQPFRIHALNSQTGMLVPVELKLEQAKSLPFALAQGGDAGLHSFRLIFHGPVDQPLEQGTFEIAHPEHGSMLIFLVPVGQKGGMREYEAIFNRAA